MRLRRELADDDLHQPDDDPTYNESRYYSCFDRSTGLGGWIRMGNRPNEGYAEMTVCLYLPDGTVGFMFQRPPITGNAAHDAGGLRFTMVRPFAEHRVHFDGRVCLLANPRDMADPATAFRANPHVPCTVDLHLVAVAQPIGGEPEYEPGEERPTHGFAKGHTEQQMAVDGVITVGDQRFEVTGARGLRDHSWGPRSWQSIAWYRWLTVSFERFGIGCTLRGDEDPTVRHAGGYVYDLDRYGDDRCVPVTGIELSSDYDDEHFPLANRARITTDDHTYELEGRIWSAIPLRNRRNGLVTRITENATWWTCDGQHGAGMSEYLDQVIDGQPVGRAAGA